MIATFEDLLGKKAVVGQQPFNKSDMLHTWANIDKAKQLLNWQPQIEFELGMSQTVKWYQANKDWLKNIQL